MTSAESGHLVIISGPSGSGKSTLLDRLLERCRLPLVQSVSATTRPPRPGEIDGRHYHFLSAEQFSQLREAGQLLESFEVHGRGTWYGTLRREVTPRLAQGKWVVLEIDVQGMQSVVAQYPEAITIWVHPGSQDELERRLRGRGTESETQIQRRLESARREWAQADQYQYQIVNDQVDRAVDEICTLLVRVAGASPAAH